MIPDKGQSPDYMTRIIKTEKESEAGQKKNIQIFQFCILSSFFFGLDHVHITPSTISVLITHAPDFCTAKKNHTSVKH